MNHASPAVLPAAEHSRRIEAWRQQRLASLTAPDGWLSLVGLEWLEPGTNRIGRAPDNDRVLTAGPAHLGTLTLDSALTLELNPDAGATVDGRTVRQATLTDDGQPGVDPSVVRFGSASFQVIDRGGRKGLRVRDSEAATRTHFVGIETFPVDAAWRIVARWVPFDPPQTLQMGNVLGTLDTVAVPGKAVFEYGGRMMELRPYQEEPGGELFFVFADATSGRETYGAARFLYAALPEDGIVVLDFNCAYNPPCAFTAFATCPLAPPENRLDLRMTAGELKYSSGHG